jgi:threonylcarbamoyladenosine tRNA methylthiotransferase CDKAL1
LDLISESKPEVVNCSRYGARPGTSATLLDGRLTSEVAKTRSGRVHELATKVSSERNMKWIGWRGSIIIDEVGQNFIQGRNYAYKPVFIRKKEFNTSSAQLGDRIMVQIKRCSSRALEAVELG